jgi:hypothetical protein
MLRDKFILFYDVELLAPCSTPKLEDSLSSAVHNYSFNTCPDSPMAGSRLLHPKTEDALCRGEIGVKLGPQTWYSEYLDLEQMKWQGLGKAA